MTQPLPHKTATLATDLRELGLAAGDTVLVHSSMRAVGSVAGGVQAVVQALLDVLGPDGTLVVPTHMPANSDPAGWENPPVPPEWWPVIREHSPGFDPDRTPSRWMGVLPEVVRAWPGARRSGHPQVSFAALGARAATVAGTHPLEDGLGDGSPLGAVYRADGKVLLLGCGHDRNTSLHLAECRQTRPSITEHGAAVHEPSGRSRWLTWTAPLADASDFAELGAAYEALSTAQPSPGVTDPTASPVRIGRVGNAESRLLRQRPLVDFATDWLNRHRS
ncbi:aminoglycoside N(3)-acetyltransferase [Paractinoplanes atraurantiacus]|uniref:Aminoglycoside N(3)-acetyltransferase n=1 Tax=Paractinoplanes atraurantiacus TaxID=1036182 RepID=A0A285HDB5_9ACTN|nr:AAC(3) family N-acetyltransferase [Actinoplanes atraurantiacus]SNY33657.1 aminoglycoside 3-N-acetyltransferase [Actinoplanes atraurantiacus]